MFSNMDGQLVTGAEYCLSGAACCRNGPVSLTTWACIGIKCYLKAKDCCYHYNYQGCCRWL